LLETSQRGPNTTGDGSSTTTEYVAELARRHRRQLRALGSIAVEMHQRGELDETEPYTFRASLATIMGLAARVAETERELARQPVS
jgi:hypothetical protein